MQLSVGIWEIVLGAIVTLLVGGGTGGLAYAFVAAKDLENKRRETMGAAIEAARGQVNAQWAILVARYDEANAKQAQRIDEQDQEIEALQQALSSLSAELSQTKHELSLAQFELRQANGRIEGLGLENVALRKDNEQLKRRIRELKKQVEEEHGH